MKQHLEGYFSESLKANGSLYYKKLQVHPLAHQKMPADYFVVDENGYPSLIECKECNINATNKGRFDFEQRITQAKDLDEFQNFNIKTISWLCVLFWNKTLKKSDCFLVPWKVWKYVMEDWPRKSIKHAEFCKKFGNYRLKVLKGSILNLKSLY